MAVFEIPLIAGQPQSFSIVLAQVQYRMLLIYRDAEDEPGWVLDVADSLSSPLVQGIPLVTGVDLLGQYAYLGFGGQLVVQTDHDIDAEPTFANLGDTSHLYFVTPD